MPVFLESTDPLGGSLYTLVTTGTERQEVGVAGRAVGVTCSWDVGVICTGFIYFDILIISSMSRRNGFDLCNRDFKYY